MRRRCFSRRRPSRYCRTSALSEPPPSPHQPNDHPSAGKRWRLTVLLLLGARRGEGTRVAHVVPCGLDPAVQTLEMRDADASMWPLKGSAISGYVPRDGESPSRLGFPIRKIGMDTCQGIGRGQGGRDE
jgi:hypothetical protein